MHMASTDGSQSPLRLASNLQKTRARETVESSAQTGSVDEDVPLLVAALPNKDATLVDRSLTKLCELTLWQQSNQRQVAELGGPSLLVQLVKSRLRFVQHAGSSNSATSGFTVPVEEDVDVQAVSKALAVLINLSGNDDLATRIAAVPGCIPMLVGLLSHAHQPLAVHAARCLINLTHSSPEAQASALSVSSIICALRHERLVPFQSNSAASPFRLNPSLSHPMQAGALPPTIRLLMGTSSAPPPATDDAYAASSKLACWLLANLTASHEAPTRQELLGHTSALNRVVLLAKPGNAQGVC